MSLPTLLSIFLLIPGIWLLYKQVLSAKDFDSKWGTVNFPPVNGKQLMQLVTTLRNRFSPFLSKNHQMYCLSCSVCCLTRYENSPRWQRFSPEKCRDKTLPRQLPKQLLNRE